MLRRTVLATIAAAWGTLAARTLTFAQVDATPEGTDVDTTAPRTGYAQVNGLEMYYEIHGSGGEPLVLLHGAYGTAAMFEGFVPPLAATRQVIAVEQQAHGHTADIDRPLRFEQMADDTAALLRHLKIGPVDLFGYSMGGQIALQLAIRHPGLVRKLIVASAPFASGGWFPEIVEVSSTITPELFAGTPIEAEYARVAPNPDGFPALVAKLTRLDAEPYAWPPEAIRAIPAPTLVLLGDSDGVRPEHAVELFRLRGGGVPGDLAGLPHAQLAVLPGTTHVGVVERAGWLVPMIEEFLAAPMPEKA